MAGKSLPFPKSLMTLMTLDTYDTLCTTLEKVEWILP